jgi:hypothetical protein
MDFRNKLVFVSVTTLQTSLMYAGKDGAYTRVEHLSGALIYRRFLALPTNIIRLGW